ncbi:MAG: GNAT family N-acetyltransferase [Pseudomonadota bacterium]
MKVYQALRAETVWDPVSDQVAYAALARSQMGYLAICENEALGMGRVTGDGATSFYIEDLIVASKHRGAGVGQALLSALVAKIERLAPPGAMIALLAAEGSEGFYEANGFDRRPRAGYGPAMMRIVGAAGIRH